MIVVNPLGGGGLSNAKLALADAAAGDVLAGKRFYAADKILKTGTLTYKRTVSGTLYYSDTTKGFKTINIGFAYSFACVLYKNKYYNGMEIARIKSPSYSGWYCKGAYSEQSDHVTFNDTTISIGGEYGVGNCAGTFYYYVVE